MSRPEASATAPATWAGRLAPVDSAPLEDRADHHQPELHCGRGERETPEPETDARQPERVRRQDRHVGAVDSGTSRSRDFTAAVAGDQGARRVQGRRASRRPATTTKSNRPTKNDTPPPAGGG